MDIQLFEVFAEISIAVLGFSGITAAIGSQTHRMGFLAARVKGLLFAAGITSICSVAPLAKLDLFYCSIAYIIFATSLLVWAFFGLLRNPDAKTSMVVFVIGNSLILSAICSLVYVLVLAPENLLGVYVYSLCMSLLLAGIFFIRLVLAIVSPNDQHCIYLQYPPNVQLEWTVDPSLPFAVAKGVWPQPPLSIVLDGMNNEVIGLRVTYDVQKEYFALFLAPPASIIGVVPTFISLGFDLESFPFVALVAIVTSYVVTLFVATPIYAVLRSLNLASTPLVISTALVVLAIGGWLLGDVGAVLLFTPPGLCVVVAFCILRGESIDCTRG